MGKGVRGGHRTCVRMHANFRPGKVLSRRRRIHAKTRMRSFFGRSAAIYHYSLVSRSLEKQIFQCYVYLDTVYMLYAKCNVTILEGGECV